MARAGFGGTDTLAQLNAVLERARRSSGLPALVLADEQGLLIAGAGRHTLCETLSALAPLSRGIETRTIDLAGQRAILCAPSPLAGDGVTDQVADECRAILSPQVRWVA